MINPEVLCLAAALVLSTCDDPAPTLEMSKPVACRIISGHNDYQALEDPSVSLDEKLLIYTNVTGYTVRQEKAKFQVHLVQDVNLRKQGEKRVIWGRKKIIDFLGEDDVRPDHIYLGTTIGVKHLKPGSYQAELILTDQFNPEQTHRQTIDFKVTARPAGESTDARKQ